MLAVVLLAAGLGAYTVLAADEDAGATELVLEGAADPGQDAFIPDAQLVSTGTEVTATDEYVAPDPLSNDEILARSFPGGEPGLYGGTGQTNSCNKAALVAFLEENPAKGSAFAEVSGIEMARIPGYVEGLTTVQLMHDTRVTNHGFADGAPTAFQAALQAGTAVMIDDTGVPRVKCNCGNPLSPPEPIQRTVTVPSSGTGWPSYHPQGLVTVEPAPQRVPEFTLTNVADGTTIRRPNAAAGGPDVLVDEPAPQLPDLSNVLTDSIVKADPVTAFSDLTVPDGEGGFVAANSPVDVEIAADADSTPTAQDVARDDDATAVPTTELSAAGGPDEFRQVCEGLIPGGFRDEVLAEFGDYVCYDEANASAGPNLLWRPALDYDDWLAGIYENQGEVDLGFRATAYLDPQFDEFIIAFQIGPYLARGIGDSRGEAEQFAVAMHERARTAGYVR